MEKMWILDTGIGIGIVGIFLFAYIRKIKSRLRKFILRDGGNE